MKRIKPDYQSIATEAGREARKKAFDLGLLVAEIRGQNLVKINKNGEVVESKPLPSNSGSTVRIQFKDGRWMRVSQNED